MKFLYPEFLFGLFTLAIPIIIHLFNFRKSKKVYFSSTRFLKNVKKSTSQKLKLKHYLILFSRLLFLAFLVLAFAQPYLPGTDKNPQAESVYIYLDNSWSMSNKVDGFIIVISPGKTKKDALRSALTQLESEEARVVGVVVNQIGRKNSHYYQYYYSQSYYKDE